MQRSANDRTADIHAGGGGVGGANGVVDAQIFPPQQHLHVAGDPMSALTRHSPTRQRESTLESRYEPTVQQGHHGKGVTTRPVGADRNLQ